MFTSKHAFCVCHRQRLRKESGQIIKESYQKDFCFFMGGKNAWTRQKSLKDREPIIIKLN